MAAWLQYGIATPTVDSSSSSSSRLGALSPYVSLGDRWAPLLCTPLFTITPPPAVVLYGDVRILLTIGSKASSSPPMYITVQMKPMESVTILKQQIARQLSPILRHPPSSVTARDQLPIGAVLELKGAASPLNDAQLMISLSIWQNNERQFHLRLPGGILSCVFIVPLTGARISLPIQPHDTILSLKHRIALKMQIPVEEQRLSFKGSAMKDSATIVSYDIKHEDSLQLIRRLPDVASTTLILEYDLSSYACLDSYSLYSLCMTMA